MNLRNLFWDTRDLGELFDLSQRPAIYVENSIGLAIRAGILGLGLPALAMYMVRDEFQKNGFQALSPITVILILIGLFCLMAAAFLCTRRRTIRIETDAVVVKEVSLFGVKKWQEPLDHYLGITLDTRSSRYSSHGSDTVRRSITVRYVNLLHRDKEKVIHLYQSRRLTGEREVMKKSALALNLPTLEKRDGEYVVREPEDIGKPLKQLIEEGKEEISFDTSAPPPEGVSLTEEGETLIITAPLDITGRGECILRLHRDEISVVMRIKSGVCGQWSVPGKDVTSVEIEKLQGKKEAVFIVTEQHPHHLRIRLPREGLEWLKNQILVKLVV
jgi:hypothetical protein